MKRGAISLPVELSPTNGKYGMVMGKGLSPLDLNYYALYWDELLIPSNSAVYIGVANEEPFIKAGFLKRPDIPSIKNVMVGSDVISMYVNSLTYYLDKKRNEEKDSDWRLNMIGDEFCLNESDSEYKKSFRIELTKALPVPDVNVNIQDILDFKLKRKSELDAFNNYLDELYLEVVSSGDFRLSRAKAFTKLNGALADLEKLNKQGWRSPIKFDTSALFEANNGDLINGASAFYNIWEANHGNPSAAISAGIVAITTVGLARLRPVFQSVRKKPEKHIAYLASAHKEKIIKRNRRGQ